MKPSELDLFGQSFQCINHDPDRERLASLTIKAVMTPRDIESIGGLPLDDPNEIVGWGDAVATSEFAGGARVKKMLNNYASLVRMLKLLGEG